MLLLVQLDLSFVRFGIGSKDQRLTEIWQLATEEVSKASIFSEIQEKTRKEESLFIHQAGPYKMYLSMNSDG